MTKSYFDYPELSINTSLTLLTEDIFNKIHKDFPNAQNISLFRAQEYKGFKSGNKDTPMIIYFNYTNESNTTSGVYLDFTKDYSEHNDKEIDRSSFIYTTNKDRENLFGDTVNLIHVETYKEELLKTFPDIRQFKHIDAFRKDDYKESYKSELLASEKEYLKLNLEDDLTLNSPSKKSLKI